MSIFQNFKGANKFMDRFMRKAPNVVWDLMTGKIGVQTADGIATLEGEGDDATININLIDEFGMGIPAFAQSTPVDAVKPGDIIYFGASDRPGWVIEKKVSDKGAVSFVLLKVDGQRTSWKPPKVTLIGMDSGVMVLRSLMGFLPGGQGGLAGLQGMLLPMMMMNGGKLDGDMENMLPMMLMTQIQAGTTTDGQAAQNPMAQMMSTMMMMKFMNKQGGMFNDVDDSPAQLAYGSGNKSPFNRS